MLPLVLSAGATPLSASACLSGVARKKQRRRARSQLVSAVGGAEGGAGGAGEAGDEFEGYEPPESVVQLAKLEANAQLLQRKLDALNKTETEAQAELAEIEQRRAEKEAAALADVARAEATYRAAAAEYQQAVRAPHTVTHP